MEYGDRRTLAGEHEIPFRTLGFAVLGAPLAWVVHLGVSYFLVALGCSTRWSGTDAALAVATLLLAAVAAGAGLVAHRAWRQVRVQQAWLTSMGEPRGRSSFLTLVGVGVAAIFTLLILLAGLPPLFVPTCT
jgi:hypothetical protein